MDGRTPANQSLPPCRRWHVAVLPLVLAVLLAPGTRTSADEPLRRLPSIGPSLKLLELREGDNATTVYPEKQASFDSKSKIDREVVPASVRQPTFEASKPQNRVQFSKRTAANEPAEEQEPVTPRRIDVVDEGDDDSAEKDEKQKQEEQKKLGQAPVSNTMQFLRTESVLLKPGKYQIDTGIDYTLFDNDFPNPVFDAQGNVIEVVEGHFRQRLLFTPLAVRYGWSDCVQLFAALPIGWSNTQNSIIGDSISTNSGGIGDLTGGASVLLWKGEEECPDLIGTIAVTLPTGDFNAPILGIVPGSSLGQGFWGISAQVSAIHQYDPVTVFYGVGFRHLFERQFEGTPFQPGEQVNYQMGVGFSVNDRVTLSSTLQGFYITDFAQFGRYIEGTNLEPLSVRFAATIARCGKIVEPFVQVGMTDSAPAASLGITVTFY